MKKKIIIIVSIVLALVIGFLIWWNVPVTRNGVEFDSVEKVTIIDLATGEEVVLSDADEYEMILPFPNKCIRLYRRSISFDNLDSGYKVKIEAKDEAIDAIKNWDEFNVTSDNLVRKGFICYEQSLGWNYYNGMQSLFEENK